MIRGTYPPLLLLIVTTALMVVLPFGYVLLPLFVLLLFDYRGRRNDFKYLTEMRSEGLQLNRKMMDRYGRTWCGRTVFVTVFPSSQLYYYSRGYRWFHVLPDGVLTRNSPFLKKNFWINLVKGHRR